MKRIVSIVLISLVLIASVLCCFSGCEIEVKRYECDGMSFVEADYRKLMLVSYSGDATEIIIPENLEGKEVVSVGSQAFEGAAVQSVTVPSTVSEICGAAFKNCKNLTDISLGYSIESIGSFAFYGCTALENISLPSTVTEIGTAAFACSGLKEFQHANGVKKIGEQAFYGCVDMKLADIPSAVTSIGNSAFYNCPSLEWIFIPSEVTSIGKKAVGFYENADGKTVAAENIVICGRPDTTAFKYANENGIAFMTVAAAEDLDYDIVGNNAEITEYSGEDTAFILPASIDGRRVIGIDKKAFAYKMNIESVTLPQTVTYIGQEAFLGCSRLSSISIPEEVSDIGGGAFFETPWFNGQTDEFVIVGDGILIDYNGSAAEVIIPDKVKKISGAFYSNATLQSVQIPQSVSVIGEWAFLICAELKSVTMTSNVTAIEESAFSWCVSLESIEIGSGVTKIGKETFFAARKLSSVILPQGLKMIGDEAFGCCDVLTSVTIPSEVEEIGDDAFDKQTLRQIIGEKNSAAWEFARKNSIPFTEI